MADRKAELERKKAKLLAIREEKKKRDNQKASHAFDSDSNAVRQSAEELLKDLGIPEPSITKSLPQELDSPDLLPYGSLSCVTKKRKNLQISDLIELAIPPPETVIYNKETQTVREQNDRENRSTDYYVLTYEDTNRDDVDAVAALAELEKMPHVGLTKSMHQDYDEGKSLLEEPQLEIRLTEEEKLQLISSAGFTRFFERSSRIIERALCQTDDLLFDYSGADNETEVYDELLTPSHEFFDEHWSKHRTVTSLDWSTIFPELLLTAYHMNEESVHEPGGVCLIWNMKYPKKMSPEFIFHCQSPVTSATLSRFHPNVVVGSTYSGQIVLWDSRVNKRTPIQRSPLASIIAVTLVGTQNAHNIISLGSDGSLCAWSLEMLTQPREKGKVCEMSSGGLFDIYPTCMSFFANDVNNYAVGAENGNAYCGQRHSSRSDAPEEASRCVPYKGHGAPLTAISTHPSPGPISFSTLFLTASLDWTVKLWSSREHKPLHTFDDYFDYVYDVSWSPVHPAIFAAVDGTGRLDIWNINQDVEVPTARRIIGIPGNADPNISPSITGAALNKCRWSTTGTLVAVGDDGGRVTVCNVHESLAQPGSDDWSAFAHSLADLKHYEVDTEIRAEA